MIFLLNDIYSEHDFYKTAVLNPSLIRGIIKSYFHTQFEEHPDMFIA